MDALLNGLQSLKSPAPIYQRVDLKTYSPVTLDNDPLLNRINANAQQSNMTTPEQREVVADFLSGLKGELDEIDKLMAECGIDDL